MSGSSVVNQPASHVYGGDRSPQNPNSVEKIEDERSKWHEKAAPGKAAMTSMTRVKHTIK
jgi:hypothetical protein